MTRTLLIPIALILFPCLSSGINRGVVPLAKQSIPELQQHKKEVEAELEQLSAYSLRGGAGVIGYRSADYADPHHLEWIKIEFDEERSIDQIVMVPTIWHYAKTGFSADGFPIEFHWIAGTAADTNGTEIARFTEKDSLLPRIAPVIFDGQGIQASWVKLVVTKMSPRAFDNQYNLELAEVMVFSGTDNVALHEAVTASSSTESESRGARFLVDGFTPHLMDTAQGEQSLALISTIATNKPAATLEIDLGEPRALDRIHLHAVEQSDTVPQSFVNGLGIPKQMQIEGASQPDFSDATPLATIYCRNVYEAAPILIQKLQPTTCQYVRLKVIDPYLFKSQHLTMSRFGFAEIELLSNGKNVALGQSVKGNFEIKNVSRSFANLTDGRNLYGRIIPQRNWMNELARRHALEAKLPLIVDALNTRFAQQHAKASRLSWVAGLLITCIALLILINRYLRMRQVTRIKARFAADLHDELGANLHAIGILGTYAKEVLDAPEKLARTVDEIKALTDRTGEATRYCSDIQTAKEAHENLPLDLERTARRVLANLEYELNIEGHEFFRLMRPHARTNLFLFFKESLVNANRHANATTLQIQLTATKEQIRLSICDDGCGIATGDARAIPASLQRRAKLLGAKVTVESAPNDGTCISLHLKNFTKRRLF